MGVVHVVVPPWAVTLTEGQRTLVEYAVVVAMFTFAAMLVRMLGARREVGDRYRPAVYASAGAVLVAFLSYLLLLLTLQTGYVSRGGSWVPTAEAVGSWSARYMDWTVSVPLLVVEIVAVSAFTGRAARRARTAGAAAAVAMVLLGFLGGVVVDGGRSFGALLGFGIASSVCFALLYLVVIVVVLRSLPVIPAASRGPLRSAMIVLVVTWFVYPVVLGLQGLVSGGAYTVAAHLALCTADVVAKVVFGLLLLRVARIRTAADVVAGEDVHHEGVWVDQVRVSGAVQPPRGD